MLSRPLDLASRLRPEPRNFDWLFIVNGGLIALFFTFFASQFVLSPALGVDFRLPEVLGATAGARPATHHLDVTASGQIFVDEGVLTLEQLRVWLVAQAKTIKAPLQPVLNVRATIDAPLGLVASICDAARAAGFRDIGIVAVEPAAPSGGRG